MSTPKSSAKYLIIFFIIILLLNSVLIIQAQEDTLKFDHVLHLNRNVMTSSNSVQAKNFSKTKEK